MNTRHLIFKNYRNLGVENSRSENLSNTLLIGSIDEGYIGGLIILLGGNNDGKSNVLDGFMEFGKKELEDRDKPNFIDHENEIPKLILDYKITYKEKIVEMEKVLQSKNEMQDIESKDFSGKTFGIVLRKNVVTDYENRQKDRHNKSDKTCQQYWQDVLDSDIYALQREG